MLTDASNLIPANAVKVVGPTLMLLYASSSYRDSNPSKHHPLCRHAGESKNHTYAFSTDPDYPLKQQVSTLSASDGVAERPQPLSKASNSDID